WFRNNWSWGATHEGQEAKPSMKQATPGKVALSHPSLHEWAWEVEPLGKKAPEIAFTETETNLQRCFGGTNNSPYVKDGINDYVVNGKADAINPDKEGTKAAAIYSLEIPAGKSVSVRMRLYDVNEGPKGNAFADFD